LATVVPLGDFCFPETFMRNHQKIWPQCRL
jgi:hypothetical protein